MGKDKFLKAPKQVLHFLIQDTLACIELHSISQTILLPLLEAVPNSQHYLIGLLNFHGKSIPVVDLASRLNIERQSNYSLDTPILLCTNDVYQAGVIVDRVLGISSVDAETFQMQEEFNNKNSDFLGTIIYESRLSLLINIKFILETIFTIEAHIRKKHSKKEKV